ncbi:MAG: insulinase family protein [Acidobacteriota bacterium]
MKNTLTSFFTILSIFIIIYTSANAASLPSGVSIHRLDNGMEVLLIRNPGLPMIGSNMVVKIGSAYETFATSGMSHMLEHLLFNGTKSRTQKELYDDTDRIGGYNNANTSSYYTNYMMVTPEENFEKGLEIQADMLFNSTLPGKKFKKEKGIVLEEISKSIAEPSEQLERNVISVIYKGHALSLPTLGTYSTIKSMSRDEVYSFYKNNYVPNNMILSVIGDFDTREMLDLINKIYGIQKSSNVLRPDNREWKTGLEKNGTDNTEAGTWHRSYNGKENIIYNFLKIDEKLSPASVKLVELALKKESKKLFKILNSEFPEDLKDVKLILRDSPVVNFIEVKTKLKNNKVPENISDRISELVSNFKYEVRGSELDSEILRLKTNFLKNIEKPHMFGIFNAYNFAVNGIESVLSLYNGSEFTSASSKIKELNISASPLTLVQSPSPESKKDSSGSSSSTKLFSDPEKGKTLIVTDNGGSNLLAIHYMFKHKAEIESKFGKGLAKTLHHIFGNRLKSEDVLRKISKFGLTYKVNDNPFFPMDDIYLHPDFGYIRVEGLADDVPGVIEFLNSEMLDFTPTESEYKKAASELMRMASPMMMRGGNIAKKIFDKVYSAEIIEKSKYEESKEKSGYENLLKFSKEYFTPDNVIISISSPLDTGSVNKLFANFYNGKAKNRPEPWEPGLRMREKPVTIEKDGKGKRSYLFWGYTKKIEDADKTALQALSLYLSDKIVFDIREKRGMAYRMSAGIKMKGDKALFYINMGTRPANVDKLVKIFPEFFRTGIIKDLNGKDLERLINMYLGRMKLRRLSSINRAYYLSHSLYFNNDINYNSEFLKGLKEITIDKVKEVAKKYMVIENPATIIVR